jgi:hypothetical protein
MNHFRLNLDVGQFVWNAQAWLDDEQKVIL